MSNTDTMLTFDEQGLEVVYLSGPMSGLPDFNFRAFHNAAAALRRAGVVVINPAETAGGEKHMTREWYMRIDLTQIITSVDAVVVLPGWSKSKGALTEVSVADAIGLPVFTMEPIEWDSYEIEPLQINGRGLAINKGGMT